MGAILGVWTVAVAAYLLFAGEASAEEIAAGAVCAAAAVLWWAAVRRASSHAFAFEWGGWATMGRAVRGLPSATGRVAAVLARAVVGPVGGALVERVYVHGRRADPADAGRRAIGVLTASLAPDSFVLRTPIDRDVVVVHVLAPGAPSGEPRWPI